MAPHTIACFATGPTLSEHQFDVARARGWPIYCCNNAIQLAPDAALLWATNYEWWRTYWDEVSDLPCEKWTVSAEAADQFVGVNWIDERNGVGGFSTDPSYIHSGYGGGYSLCSMAHRAGAKRIILLGYSLSYASNYNASARQPGASPRHSLLLLRDGEYPAHLQHWPSVAVKDGVHVELLRLYRCIVEQGLVELVNCTPDSALNDFLPYREIDTV